jgi:hypothetical protein
LFGPRLGISAALESKKRPASSRCAKEVEAEGLKEERERRRELDK